jgi:deoxyribodipyrimidine photolyase-related protein
MFIDSYDWVMVANVYGMGLFADGGIFATKPYISGGNYLKKMSDYPDHKIWESIWTDKFWNFLLKHEEFFKTNPRLSMLISSKKNKMIN